MEFLVFASKFANTNDECLGNEGGFFQCPNTFTPSCGKECYDGMECTGNFKACPGVFACNSSLFS